MARTRTGTRPRYVDAREFENVTVYTTGNVLYRPCLLLGFGLLCISATILWLTFAVRFLTLFFAVD